MREHRKQLASYVLSRRVELGFTTRSAWATHLAENYSEISPRTLGNLERGLSVGATTLAIVERALGWEPGSVETILHGGKPTVMHQQTSGEYADPTDPQEMEIWRLNLPEELRRMYIDLYRLRKHSDAEPERRAR